MLKQEWTQTQLNYEPFFVAQLVENKQKTRHWEFMIKEGVGVGIGTKVACGEATCICDTTCNGPKTIRTSCIGGMITHFVAHLRLPTTLVGVGCACISSSITSKLSCAYESPTCNLSNFHVLWER